MNKLIPALRRACSQPGFIVVAVLLFIAAAGLNAATGFLQLHFKKLPVPLERPLSEVPERLGPWVQVTLDEVLNAEIQDALATDKYVFRNYVDSRLVKESELAAFKDKSPEESRQMMWMLQLRNPAAVMNLALTYYTGLADTVAHVPDRCYIADGYQPTKYDVEPWDALKGRPGDGKVRAILFEDPTPSGKSLKWNVAYFFNCNGKYINDPIGVRTELADLFQHYGYYMKVELKTLNLSQEDAARVMNDFLTHAVPEAEKCLPAWEKYRSAK